MTDSTNATPYINTGGLQDFPKKQNLAKANRVRGFGVVHARNKDARRAHAITSHIPRDNRILPGRTWSCSVPLNGRFSGKGSPNEVRILIGKIQRLSISAAVNLHVQ